MATPKKQQKPPTAIRLSDEHERYLRDRATEQHRTLTGEVSFRLERSIQQEIATRQKVAPSMESSQQPSTKEGQQ